MWKMLMWDELPQCMQNEQVQLYYEYLKTKRCSLFFKRTFDVLMSVVLLILLLPIFIVLAICIKLDSKGPVFFRQIRVTQYAKEFHIFKFRTMVVNAEKLGSQVTTKNDLRVTRVGKVIRKTRLDELPQLINILLGQMSFVGTRPEVPKYVMRYSPEMYATLLLPAGVTSEASVRFKDESSILNGESDVDDIYVSKILPIKMKYNLEMLKEFNLFNEFKIMFRTVGVVVGGK